MIHDETQCTLGEGPLWHPKRNELFWFDILGKRLHRSGEHWHFDGHVSAAGWVDDATLLVADAAGLFLFDLETGAREDLVALEADNPATRSNDGRADPHGGFWIGTMGIGAEPGAGAIYRYYRGEVRQLFAGLTIPNAICFSPDGGHAHFTDTPTRRIMRQRLSARDGWPEGEPEPWLDLAPEGLNPDGAVIDAEGNFWNAQWGAGRVACYDPDGTLCRGRGISTPRRQAAPPLADRTCKRCSAPRPPRGCRTLPRTTARPSRPRSRRQGSKNTRSFS